MPELLDILQQEHADIRRILDIVSKQADRAERPDFELLQEIIAYCLSYPDQYHHPKEDLIYAALRQQDPEGAAAIDGLAAKHRGLATATRELATALEAAKTGASPDCRALRLKLRSYVRSYRDHMRKEDQEFFPYALCVIGPEEWSDLEARITDPIDPLMRAKAGQELDGLLARGSAG